jgi:hypothetical protein
VFLACGAHADLHVLPKQGEEIHQALDGEGAGLAAHKSGNLGLPHAQDHSGLCLGEVTGFDETVNLQREPCFQELPFRMGKAEVGEDISAAIFYHDRLLPSGGHVSSAFLCGVARPQQGSAEVCVVCVPLRLLSADQMRVHSSAGSNTLLIANPLAVAAPRLGAAGTNQNLRPPMNRRGGQTAPTSAPPGFAVFVARRPPG